MAQMMSSGFESGDAPDKGKWDSPMTDKKKRLKEIVIESLIIDEDNVLWLQRGDKGVAQKLGKVENDCWFYLIRDRVLRVKLMKDRVGYIID